jgi:phage gpG-like protein
MKVTAKVEVKTSAPKTTNKKPVLLTKKYTDKIFAYIKSTIEKRIDSGKDLTGKAFTPYKTPSKKGEKVDLKESGKLRDSLDYDWSLGKPIVIYYKALYAKYVNESRPFIGLTKQEETGLDKIIDEAMDEFLTALIGR